MDVSVTDVRVICDEKPILPSRWRPLLKKREKWRTRLKTYGVIVEEQRTFRKVAGALEVIGVGLAVADSLNSGVLRKLVLYLRDLAIPEDEILRLRLDEPETISELLRVRKTTKKTKSAKSAKTTTKAKKKKIKKKAPKTVR
jgi:hypothetical protein